MPQTFKDNTGREWEIAIHFRAIEDVRRACDVDLLELAATPPGAHGGDARDCAQSTDARAEKAPPIPRLIHRLSSDPVLLANVVYVLCRQQCEDEGVSDEAFGRALVGDAIHDACIALLRDLIDFFPSPSVRRALGNLLKVMLTTETAIHEAADKQLTELETRLDSLPATFAALSGKPLESLASSLGTTPSDSSSGCKTAD